MGILGAMASPYVQVAAVVVLLCIAYAAYRTMRRMTDIRDLPRDPRGRRFWGVVTSVGDGDGFRIFHVPWMRSAAFTRRSPKLPVRLAGVDAPEMRFFSVPAQPCSREAREHLRSLVLGKTVCVDALSIDMYGRIIAVVYVPRGWFSRLNVNLEMVKTGFACVYDRAGAEYGGYKAQLEAAQETARKKRIGMWANKRVVLPMDHKKDRK